MPNNYPPEFRRQMVELVRAERTPEELAKAFQPSAQSICTWVRQADLDDGRRQDGLSSAEKDELARLRRENKILREEKEILCKAEACKDVMPTPFLRNKADKNWSMADKRKYATCMRTFPVPDTSGDFKLDDDDANTPQFKKAEETCKQYQPQSIPSMTPTKAGGS
ncbi:transposase [Nonomuraea sp. NPDC050202]|uniref:transposase n=1 Tax=Nonomuraea sp. NPDC050202 TaxID=3155035 RepID=UPI0034074F6A